MAAIISGIWNGTVTTETFPAYQAYGGAFGGPKTIVQLGGQPAATIRDVNLAITTQDEYRKAATGELVSTVSGQLYDVVASTPVSGFVNDTGVVKLTFYNYSLLSDATFIGRLTGYGLMHDISGHLMNRTAAGTNREPWAWAWIDYYFGMLSVKRLGLNLSDRAYIGNDKHIF
jgi:hypothetical protein